MSPLALPLLAATLLGQSVPLKSSVERPTGSCPDKCDYLSRLMGAACANHKTGSAQKDEALKKLCGDEAEDFLDACHTSCKQTGEMDSALIRKLLEAKMVKKYGADALAKARAMHADGGAGDEAPAARATPASAPAGGAQGVQR